MNPISQKNPILHKYTPVGGAGAAARISVADDDDDDNVEISLQSDTSIEMSKSPNRERLSGMSSLNSQSDLLDEDGDEENSSGGRRRRRSSNSVVSRIETDDACTCLQSTWNMLTFAWVRPLLELGNKRALEQDDLYTLNYEDTAEGASEAFHSKWHKELRSKKPSVAMAFMLAFGGPFVAAGGLKLVHDSCLFVSPLMLNRLIHFLSDPGQHTSVGLGYVLIIFLANVLMSLCLRQYFYWCYLVGMRLRSAVITSVYTKSLVLSTGAMGCRSSGEIMNLMSVDASRMQSLTPYLHAIWYSFFQIAVAMYFLFQQVGYAALAGVTIIILLIPATTKLSTYLKGIQKEISSVRDERVKVTNEVLAGMKVIKFEAWEQEFEARIAATRNKELALFRRYMIMQSMFSALYTAIPLLVAISTFTMYVVVMGRELTIANALTSLALFDILRFPLFMLPNVLNNVIEAKVSLDRIQAYLLEAEVVGVPSILPQAAFAPPTAAQSAKGPAEGAVPAFGAVLRNATLIFEKRYNPNSAKAGGKKKEGQGAAGPSYSAALAVLSGSAPSSRGPASDGGIAGFFGRLRDATGIAYLATKRKCIRSFRNAYGTPHSRSSVVLMSSGSVSGQNGILEVKNRQGGDSEDPYEAEDEDEEGDDEYAGREFAYQTCLTTQQLLYREAEEYIELLEADVAWYKGQGQGQGQGGGKGGGGYAGAVTGAGNNNSSLAGGSILNMEMEDEEDEEGASSALVVSSASPALSGSRSASPMPGKSSGNNNSGRVDSLTLSRVNLVARPGDMVCIVGQVGSGKTSMLRALLGDLSLLNGDVALRGKCSYVGQKPFIQNATLRDNIVFGEPFDDARYKRTLDMCALLPDLEMLPAGDSTEIGERGINLSGGQKTRVAIARAVYADSDVYLLDDPLAAVDAHVGQHLFVKCLLELQSRGKCIVLVTNALQYTKVCTRICVMFQGRVAESGSYDSLLQQGQAHASTRGNKNGNGNKSGSSASGCSSEVRSCLFYDMIRAYEEEHCDDDSQLVVADGVDDVKTALVLGLAAAEKEAQVAGSPKARTKSLSGAGQDKKDRAVDKPSQAAVATAASNASGKLTGNEDRETGTVDRRVYWSYLAAFGGGQVAGYLLFIYLLAECINVLASWWLSYWSEHATEGSATFYLTIYIVINVAVAAASLFRELQLRLKSLDASKSMYNSLLKAVLYAPMSFFDTTPLGRIVNRFSKDVNTVDESLPGSIRMYLGSLMKVMGVLLYISVVTPFFIITLIPIGYFYHASQKYYISTSRELSRLESVSRSPIYALFSETIDGMTTLRAYGAQNRFAERNNLLLDNNNKAYFLNFSANCWLAVRLEMAGTMIVTFAALTAVLSRDSISRDSSVTDGSYSAYAGMAGLAISLSLSVTQSLNWSVRMASDVETNMVSVERVTNYIDGITPEAAYIKRGDPQCVGGSGAAVNSPGRSVCLSVTDGTDGEDGDGHGGEVEMMQHGGQGSSQHGVWPTDGVVEFRSVSLRYRPGLPLILNDISFVIRSREKIGVVGRTGAGKSSLLTALLRLVEVEDTGRILIDGVDISSLGLKALRSAVTVIPQDPVLFSGSIRSNLDPFGNYTDEQIWQSIRRVTCKNKAGGGGSSSSNGSAGRWDGNDTNNNYNNDNNNGNDNDDNNFVQSLEDKVEENGGNYSVGQRQLLCIARALLTRSKVIVMDEATAAIDVETDAAIQKAIRTDFANATCITIAHRLNTIMDCDRILVMDKGTVGEFDSPQNLLARPGSMFSALVENFESSK